MAIPAHAVLADANVLPIRVLRCARAQLWPWWHLRNCRPLGWLLYANDNDGACIIRRGRRIALPKDHTVVIPPGCVYDTAPGPDTHQLYCEFDVPGLPTGMPTEPCDLGADPLLAALSRSLHASLVLGQDLRDPAAIHLAHAWIRLSFSRLFNQIPVAVRDAWLQRDRDPLEGAVETIERNLDQPLYVSVLAERCGMGQQWFTKRFRARFGKSPAQYLVDRRVAVAAQRLVHDQASVDEVADSCGFTDRAHFTKAFTKRLGMPPGRYREAERRRFTGGS
jgi:AraC-like DNA-binding protein